ncbi:unnamed protein product [Allacma fusca]|uniref:Uncharacterized protein n=1 Tax=Allacma fusca TaxID=39272 RepID=A0A8J2K0Q5_9HEXA|nr:unnamed protein product [Allacma fusca]
MTGPEGEKSTVDLISLGSLPRVSMDSKRNSVATGASELPMKYITSSAIWFGSFSFGISYNLFPSLLTELKGKYGTDIETISRIFTVILLTYVLGSLICGSLFNYINRQLTLAFLMFTLGICALLVPHMPTLTMLFVLAGFYGFTSGGIDTAQIVWILELWKGQAGIFVQTHYFFFALGSFVAPLMLNPFLLEENSSSKANASENGSMFGGNDPSTTTTATIVQESQIYVPMCIAGGIILISASYILFLFFCNKYKPEEEVFPVQDVPRKRSIVSAVSVVIDLDKGWTRNKLMLVILSAVVLSGYQGMEVSTVQFLPTFAHNIALKLPEPEAALVTSGLTGAFTAGRFLGILIVFFKLPPTVILLANMVLSFTGNIILCLFATDNLNCLWAGAVLLGLGYSTIFPCVYDYIEKYLTVTNFIGTVFIVSGGGVAGLYPFILGPFVETHPLVLTYLVFLSIAVCIVSFGLIYFVTAIRKKSMNMEFPPHDGL